MGTRATQYIGLTAAAEKYVAETAISSEQIVLGMGMFDEPVYGKRYHLPAPSGPNKAVILTEVIQAEPWSSGPMILTRLKCELIKDSMQVVDLGTIFDWVRDPTCKCEVDQQKGVFWV